MSDELADEVTQLNSRLDGMANLIDKLRDKVAALEEENEEQAREMSELRRQMGDMQDGTDLLQQVKKSMADSKDRKIAIILMTLRNDAKRRDAPATMTAKECWEALNRQPDRTTMYGLMSDAADAIEGDVVTYIKEERSAKHNTRLKMDPSEGTLPSAYEGHDLTGEVEA